MPAFESVGHDADFCVTGGGLAGLCAAVAAARRGLRVVLMHDRPMLGGNASSEIRMWVLGAAGKGNRETGIIEELMLENLRRNPYKNYHIWDGILYSAVRREKNIKLLLNCSCLDAETENDKIISIKGWQTTTQKYHRVAAGLFADCSGDSVLAPLTGAAYRVGREAQSEYGEAFAPAEADKKTMGMSILMQARETERNIKFEPPEWAEKYTREDLPHRLPNIFSPGENFWYLELGGNRDTIADTEQLRDELLAVAYGMWDFIKNDPANKEKNARFELDWMGFLPGKRESRRYEGDYVMTMRDVASGGRFFDTVAYGGWPMDDHHPEGFRASEPPTVYHPAPSPYGIPFRCLYSKNICNLMFAGRNISVTHSAFSSTRVMATCAVLGQAAGTAAAIAAKHKKNPREIYEGHMDELQCALLEDDCYLPGFARKPEEPALSAEFFACGNFTGEPRDLTNGADREKNGRLNGVSLSPGASLTMRFAGDVCVSAVRLVFDSGLDRDLGPNGETLRRPMHANYYLNAEPAAMPPRLAKNFRLTTVTESGEQSAVEIKNNFKRLVYVNINKKAALVKFEPLETWGNDNCTVFSFDSR
ncbi:MAG: FAD-dependent oxidoreductase [Defluviitaleaceae bacterium]|nr:FAD-dependent oxidoreductase [Defluviitaleaceae bacterium]